MSIKGKKVTLRAIERTDLATLQVWANDDSINQMIGGWHFPTNMRDTETWFEALNLRSLNQRYIIETPGEGTIGSANLVAINWKDRNAEHGLLIGNKDAQGKGYAVDTIMAIMKYAFEELGLNRLDTTIIEYNEPSINLYSNKCGWKKEGEQRNWYFRKNKYWSRLFYGITKDDYAELIEKTNYWNEG